MSETSEGGLHLNILQQFSPHKVICINETEEDKHKTLIICVISWTSG